MRKILVDENVVSSLLERLLIMRENMLLDFLSWLLWGLHIMLFFKEPPSYMKWNYILYQVILTFVCFTIVFFWKIQMRHWIFNMTGIGIHFLLNDKSWKK